MHGWIILDKPLGLGSTQGVSAVKRALRDGGYGPKKKDMPKVGHGGTLDPLATGVLPVAIGEATKLAGRMLDSDKVYDFTICFGVETDTLDAEGKEIARSDTYVDHADVEDVLVDFIGPIQQVPPAYSALKVDGERAYDLARAGETVALKKRDVTIHDLRFQNWWNEDGLQYATLTAHVSKGTYIRSLARDIARAVGSVGHVTYLRRTKAGPFGLEHAISLDKLADAAKERRLEELLLPLRAGLDDIPALLLTPGQAGLLRSGQQVTGTIADDGLVFAMLDDVPVALAEVQSGIVRVVRGFNL
ncbi:MAG: tRNA pseudouridine(55) synthase TruB [Sphingomonas sp.]|nr:tRNA pseudouridine(55) synthase TruB [Sphingomonas sp.]